MGDYCSFSGCGALDFLPHKCPYCVKNFCTKHRLPEEHQCASTAAATTTTTTTTTTKSSSSTSATKIEASSKTVASSRLHVVTREEAIANGRTNRAVSAATGGCCGVCGSTVAPLITCDACGMVNCALHRLAERHDCIALAKVASEQTARKEKLARVEEAAAAAKERAEAYVRKKLAKAQAKAQRRKKKEMTMMMKEAGDGDSGGDGGVGGVGGVGDVGVVASGCSSSAEIILMRLKHSATGKKSVPIEKRYHALVVHHEAETNRIRAKALWFSRKWSVGKVLDVAAEALKVTNNNNNINASHGGGGENCASYGNSGNDDPTTPTTTATATTITTTTTKRLSLFRASDAKQLDDTKIKISEAIEDGATIVLTTLASISTCDERYALY